MKFGQTLEQRSVQQWRHYNLDYSTVKRLIKEHTDPSTKAKDTVALSIPGKGPSQNDAFDSQLLALLTRECNRLDLFVKSKQYELNSRLGTVDRQIAQLQHRRQISKGSRNAVGLQRRFAKLETELLRVGEEIQNTSRFIATNRMAFQKLIKKHRKWTASPALAARVEEQLLNRSGSFAKVDLATIMQRYADHLDGLRNSVDYEASTPRPNLSVVTSAGEASEAARAPPSGIDFDVELQRACFTTSPTATYWVHADNVVELRVLLLQYTRHADLLPPTPEAQRQQRRDSGSNVPADTTIGAVAFASPSVHARWAGADAAIMLSSKPSPLTTKLDRNTLARCLSAEGQRKVLFADTDSDISDDVSTRFSEDEAFLEIQSKLRGNSEATPLARVTAARSRFVGFGGSRDRLTKAALDTDVRMAKTSVQDLKRRDFFKSNTIESMEPFPHAVLTVSAGDANSSLIKALDSSHLTERVEGFSMTSHAIAACCQPNAFAEPAWMARLSEDIRHLPPQSDPPSRKNSIRGLPSSSGRNSPKDTSRSATTLTGSDGPVTPDAAVMFARSRLLPLETHMEVDVIKPKVQRYWNEYDNPDSENGEEEPFTIEVYPDERPYPRVKDFVAWQRKLVGFFKTMKLRRDQDAENRDLAARAALTRTGRDDAASPSSDSSDEEDGSLAQIAASEHGAASPRSERRRQQNAALLRAAALGQNYGTINAERVSARGQAKVAAKVAFPRQVLHTASLLLAAAATITILMGFMAVTSRRKAHPIVAVVLLLGCATSFLFEVFAFARVASACGWGNSAELNMTFAEQGLGLVIPEHQQQTWMDGLRAIGARNVVGYGTAALVITVVDVVIVAWALVE